MLARLLQHKTTHMFMATHYFVQSRLVTTAVNNMHHSHSICTILTMLYKYSKAAKYSCVQIISMPQNVDQVVFKYSPGILNFVRHTTIVYEAQESVK